MGTVLAAHRYSLDFSFPVLLSTLAATVLWVVLGALIMSRVANPMLRRCVGLAFFGLLALYYTGQLISFYQQGSYYNAQFFFHLNWATLTETWEINYPFVLLFFAVFLGIEILAYSLASVIDRTRVPVALLLATPLLAISLDPHLRSAIGHGFNAFVVEQELSLDTIEWEALSLNRGALDASPGPATAGKNLVLIFLEGFDLLYTDESVFANLTPNLAKLNQTGWQLTNLKQINGTRFTMGGLVSMMFTPLPGKVKRAMEKLSKV